MVARTRSARAPSSRMARTATPGTSRAVPRHPAWATTTAPASRSTSVSARQSAVKIASPTPGLSVASTSAPSANRPPFAPTRATVLPCTCFAHASRE
jgi:hypothetical protein